MSDIRTYLMMGRPGSGKGTQAKLLAEKIGGSVIDSGSRCRAIAQQDTFFGRKTKAVIDSGNLMPEWFSIYLFEDELIKLEPHQAVVFEGAGRKPLEAREFDNAAKWLERPYKVIFLDTTEEILRKRLLERAGVEGRADDASAAIDVRFARFKEDTLKAIEFFKNQGVLVTINSDQPIEKVHQDVVKALGRSPTGEALEIQ